MFLGEPAEAEPIYQQLFDTKAIAWARLGLAKTLFMRERYAEASDDPRRPGRQRTRNSSTPTTGWPRPTPRVGELDKSQAVLAEAVAVSPHAVRRLRKLGETALETGDTDTAEKVLKQVVSKAKYSEFRDPEDHVQAGADPGARRATRCRPPP